MLFLSHVYMEIQITSLWIHGCKMMFKNTILYPLREIKYNIVDFTDTVQYSQTNIITIMIILSTMNAYILDVRGKWIA